MLSRAYTATVLMVGVALITVSVPAAAPSSFDDDFPAALSAYRTGGWQWPYSDGTGAGTVTAGHDNWTVYMDATYNAVAYAFRQTPQMYDFNVTLNFVIPTRDYTPGDQIFLALRWTNPTYPKQSECPTCALPTADSGILVDFFLGESRVFVVEIGKNESATKPFELSIGRAHQAHVELLGETVRAYLDGTQVIKATNLTSPPGLFGIMAYREDIILDKIQLDVIRTSAPPPSGPPPSTPPTQDNPGGLVGVSLNSPWIVAPVAWLLGVVTVLVAWKILPRVRRVTKRP
jgi:hypothetical protein